MSLICPQKYWSHFYIGFAIGPVWTFVRASLSHITNSPPISDPTDQDYICDGAHANSLPRTPLKLIKFFICITYTHTYMLYQAIKSFIIFCFLFNSLWVDDVIKEYGAEYIIALNTVGGKLVGNPDSKADPNISVLRFIKKILYSVVEQFGLASPSFETVFEQLALTQTRMYAAVRITIAKNEFILFKV